VEDAEIDWAATALRIGRQVRAYQPWPGSFTWWRGERLKILEGAPLEGQSAEPGFVISVADGGVAAVGIGTGHGVYRVDRLQPAGKGAMTGKAFVAGRRDFVGARVPDRRGS
jgi:methionyl-tRNA formyltransferase